MTTNQVQILRKQNGDIKVRGVEIPKLVESWFQCGLSDAMMEVIEKRKYLAPFPIQKQALPVCLSGRDMIGIAETGSGKTLAYMLPMLRHIHEQKPLEEGDGMVGLVMAPTRELAQQIYNETKVFARALGIRVVCIYGGADVKWQLGALKRGVEVVICTPGRMIDVLTTSKGKITNLRRLSYVVLDEADRMLDMGFEKQIMKIIENTRPDRQCVMFSATFPRSIENLAKKILQQPIEVIIGNRGQACTNIKQIVKVILEEDK